METAGNSRLFGSDKMGSFVINLKEEIPGLIRTNVEPITPTFSLVPIVKLEPELEISKFNTSTGTDNFLTTDEIETEKGFVGTVLDSETLSSKSVFIKQANSIEVNEQSHDLVDKDGLTAKFPKTPELHADVDFKLTILNIEKLGLETFSDKVSSSLAHPMSLNATETNVGISESVRQETLRVDIDPLYVKKEPNVMYNPYVKLIDLFANSVGTSSETIVGNCDALLLPPAPETIVSSCDAPLLFDEICLNSSNIGNLEPPLQQKAANRPLRSKGSNPMKKKCVTEHLKSRPKKPSVSKSRVRSKEKEQKSKVLQACQNDLHLPTSKVHVTRSSTGQKSIDLFFASRNVSSNILSFVGTPSDATRSGGRQPKITVSKLRPTVKRTLKKPGINNFAEDTVITYEAVETENNSEAPDSITPISKPSSTENCKNTVLVSQSVSNVENKEQLKKVESEVVKNIAGDESPVPTKNIAETLSRSPQNLIFAEQKQVKKGKPSKKAMGELAKNLSVKKNLAPSTNIGKASLIAGKFPKPVVISIKQWKQNPQQFVHAKYRGVAMTCKETIFANQKWTTKTVKRVRISPHGKPISCKENLFFVKGKGWVCERCEQIFPNSSQLQEHKSCCNINGITCEHCPRVFDSLRESRSHQSYCQKPVYKCPECPRIFVQVRTYYLHFTNYHESEYTCADCTPPSNFSNITDLRRHMNKYHKTTRPAQTVEHNLKKFKSRNYHFKSNVILDKAVVTSERSEAPKNSTVLSNPPSSENYQDSVLALHGVSKDTNNKQLNKIDTVATKTTVESHVPSEKTSEICSFNVQQDSISLGEQLNKPNATNQCIDAASKNFLEEINPVSSIINKKEPLDAGNYPDPTVVSIEQWKQTPYQLVYCKRGTRNMNQRRHGIFANQKYTIKTVKMFRSSQNGKLDYYKEKLFFIKGKGWVCERCEQVFHESCQLQDHKKDCNIDGLACEHCPRVFDTFSEIISHQSFCQKPVYKCPQCPRVYVCLHDYYTHYSNYHESAYICIDCTPPTNFSNKIDLRKHMISHTEPKVTCKSCGQRSGVCAKATDASLTCQGYPKPSVLTIQQWKQSKEQLIYSTKGTFYMNARTHTIFADQKWTIKTVKIFRSPQNAKPDYYKEKLFFIKGKGWICERCEQIFQKSRQLQDHKRGCNIDGIACEQCPRVFDTLCESKSHRQYCQRPVYKCPECPRVFLSVHVYQIHFSNYHESRYTCIECTPPKNFSDNYLLQRHMKFNHMGLKKPCKLCGQMYWPAHLERHMRLHDRKKVICVVCGLHFALFKTLRIHLKTHNDTGNPAAVMCKCCGKFFEQRAELVKHYKQHESERRIICEHCGKGFFSETNLYFHLKSHKEKKFICPKCNRAFTLKHQLAAHVRTIACGGGDNAPTSLINKKKSVKTVTQGSRTASKNMYFCAKCEKGFVSKRQLITHLRSIPCGENTSQNIKDVKRMPEKENVKQNLEKSIHHLNFAFNDSNNISSLNRTSAKRKDNIKLSTVPKKQFITAYENFVRQRSVILNEKKTGISD